MSTNEADIALPSVKNLKKMFENIDDALDNTNAADLGASHYPKAKKRTLTLSLKRRERQYSDLRSMFEQPGAKPPRGPPDANRKKKEEDKELLQKLLNELSTEDKPEEKPVEEPPKEETPPHDSNVDDLKTNEPEPEVPVNESADQKSQYLENGLNSPFSKPPFNFLPPGHEQQQQSTTEEVEQEEEEPEAIFIRTDKDLVSILMDIIHETFYNPDTGLWPKYDAEFDRTAFTCFGKPGWDAKEDTEERLAARELINHQKNIEIENLMNGEFVQNAIETIHETISSIVSGVKRRDVRRGIKNHIRVHMYYLIYGQETVLNNSRFKEQVFKFFCKLPIHLNDSLQASE